ncbi:hypothetical protein [Pseudomonas oryzihabitans]|uniref:hypothetical protein n=1 Tax=Pseudomonas oryzihabitans TaxID=47885 RepID=UPI0011A6A597|nr:hypothetical protein [Pseudomonas oryzihabitans]
MTAMYRGFVIVDRPIHTNGLDRVIDFVESGLTDFAIVQIPAGTNHRQAITRWFQRNSPNSKYLKVCGHWGRDSWLLAFDNATTRRAFNSFLHSQRQHFITWQGNDAATFIDEASRVLELSRIDGRVEGARGVNNGR